MQRIVIIGTSGSGKTTLARQLGARLGVPFVELDSLHWEPNWTAAPLAVLRERVVLAISGDAWVVDGNYSVVRDLTWGLADTVVWLDYSLWVVMQRIVRRTLVRMITREELYSGNRESFKNTFLSKDSIILWSLQTHQKNRRKYTELMSQPEYAHITMVRLRSPQATCAWLADLTPQY
ncbi:MAG TPA: AAA family ATPase [Ktedonosporobacter sp.]|nr:AAA family ATPase [Ktedonosporobacter sp.]